MDALAKFCGWTVSSNTARRVCELEGERIERWREGRSAKPADETAALSQPSLDPSAPIASSDSTGSPAPSPIAEQAARDGLEQNPSRQTIQTPAPPSAAAETFRQAAGLVEFLTDGAKVNTLDGWKEVRLALWIKRPEGSPAGVWEWQVRRLPKPSAAAVLVAMTDAESFAAKWREWSGSLGVTDWTQLTVLADGAEWIWKEAEANFPGAAGVLDVYHAMEHLSKAAKSLFGESTGKSRAWFDVGKRWLLEDGWDGVCRWIGAVRQECGQSEASVEATQELIVYFIKHTMHLNYRERLEGGKSIGSGPVEGAVKQLITKRLKQTGARWRNENVVRMTTLCSTLLAEDWDAYWTNAYQCLAI